jgi:hypothetical protein
MRLLIAPIRKFEFAGALQILDQIAPAADATRTAIPPTHPSSQ